MGRVSRIAQAWENAKQNEHFRATLKDELSVLEEENATLRRLTSRVSDLDGATEEDQVKIDELSAETGSVWTPKEGWVGPNGQRAPPRRSTSASFAWPFAQNGNSPPLASNSFELASC